jgi:putative Ca2+/H+ antiporter (TMEM165/GDT1 family)
MAAFLLAMVLTLILDQGARSQALAAQLGEPLDEIHGRSDHFTGPAWPVILALLLAIAACAVIAAAAGDLLIPLLPPDARLFFLGLALAFGGASHLAAMYRQDRRGVAGPERRHVLPLIALFALRRLGENAAFAVVAVAVFTAMPHWAAAGAIVGGCAAIAPPLTLGRAYSAYGMIRWFQGGSGTILFCSAIACIAEALHLL